MIVQIYLSREELAMAVHNYLLSRNTTVNNVPTPNEIRETMGFGSTGERCLQIEIDTDGRF